MNTQEKTTEELELEKELTAIAAKHKVETVYIIEVPFRKEILKAYLKYPDRITFGASLSLQERAPIRAKEILLKGMFLEGDNRILTEDEAFYSACTIIDEVMNIKTAYLKKN